MMHKANCGDATVLTYYSENTVGYVKRNQVLCYFNRTVLLVGSQDNNIITEATTIWIFLFIELMDIDILYSIYVNIT